MRRIFAECHSNNKENIDNDYHFPVIGWNISDLLVQSGMPAMQLPRPESLDPPCPLHWSMLHPASGPVSSTRNMKNLKTRGTKARILPVPDWHQF
ncbi:MAG: hypothetical protein PW790_10020 [Parvibaculaceae bacterium]|nr:hypothetical protein [Parvibaculaceae bacterium]